MANYAVFLRGINVGGINIKMADLKATLGQLPLTGVKTLLASGNVVCAAAIDAGKLKSLVEGALRENFGYDAWVVVLDQADVDRIVADCPYPADSTELHAYLTLSAAAEALDDLESLGRDLPGTDLVRLSPFALAWTAPVGGTLESPFSKLSSKAKFASTTTTRNIRTLLKVRDALAKLPQPER